MTQDAKGRTAVNELTDREIAEESLILLRAFGDALEAVANNPMMRGMMPAGFGR